MRWYANLTVSQKLSLVVSSTIAVTLFVVFPVLFAVQHFERHDLAKRQASRLGEAMLPGARMAIGGGPAALDQWAVEFAQLPGVESAVLYDQDWQVLRSIGAEAHGHGQDALEHYQFVDGGDTLCLTRMVQSQDVVAGYIHLELDVSWLGERSRRSLMIAVAMLGIALLLGFLLARRLLDQVAHPLKGLASKAFNTKFITN